MKQEVLELSLLSYVNGSEKEKQLFVSELIRGLKDCGFIILKDHIVDDRKIDEAYELVQKFFDLSEDRKLKYFIENIGGQRGYTPFKREVAKGSKHADLKEFWHVGRELSKNSSYRKIYGDNVWPKELPEFKKTLSELFLSLDQTSDLLLEAIGKGLGTPDGFFKDLTKDGNSILRTIHYPNTKGQDVVNSVRAEAHEDINLITLLVGATDSGLELLNRDGQWQTVKTNKDQIIVDTGDMMSMLTNGVLPSTTHRVVNPDNDKSARYSMPYFVHPHGEASLECLPTCIGDGAKFPKMTAGEYLNQRLIEIGLI